jgi:hypothetical protein
MVSCGRRAPETAIAPGELLRARNLWLAECGRRLMLHQRDEVPGVQLHGDQREGHRDSGQFHASTMARF